MLNDLRAWRAERLLSTRRLSARSGVGHRTIVQIEHGRQTPTFVTIEKLARALEVEPQQVTEFAAALEQRGGISRTADMKQAGEMAQVAVASGTALATIACISGGAAFLSVIRRLTSDGRYGTLAMIGMPVTVEQVACVQPAVVIVDLGVDTSRMLDLIRRIRQHAATALLPIVVTGRSMHSLVESVMDLSVTERLQVIPVPIDPGLRGLSGAIATLVGSAHERAIPVPLIAE